MSERDDPPRWADGGGPPGALELVRAIERPPVLPPELRARMRPRAPRPARAVGAAVATAVVIGALVLWAWRPREPSPVPPSAPELALIADAGAACEDAGSPDAGSPDAGSPDAGSPDAGSPDGGPPDAGSSGVRRTAAPRPRPLAPVAARASDIEHDHGPTGSLHVRTVPPAWVTIDGVEVGATPLRRVLRAGDHDIALRTADGTTSSFRVHITAGETVSVFRTLR